LIYSILNTRFRGPVARQPVCHGNRFVPHLLGGRPNVNPRVWNY